MQEGMAAMMRPIYFAIFPELAFFLVHWLLKIFSNASLCCANWTSQMPALRNTPPGPLPGDLRQELQVQGPKELTGPRGFCPSLWRPPGPHVAVGPGVEPPCTLEAAFTPPKTSRANLEFLYQEQDQAGVN